MVLKLTLEYDGANYSGWQLQPRHDSIQGRIEAALERIFSAPVRVYGSGRTDAGVHARGQVASISIPRPFDPAELQRALYALACRQLLPDYDRVAARLLYLAGEPRDVKLQDLDGALRQISEFVACACECLTRGVALPGLDADSPQSDLRLAMPASPAYQRRKKAAFAKSAGRLAAFWDAQ